ncbi:sensor histidine kinase [Paenibacillus sp. MBLB4367]|uniref:sensor histidine kinase n=1 Tax=Paenibacillus sp. MBLB4367 TaxID=3384767 RepID=UPI0039081F43
MFPKRMISNNIRLWKKFILIYLIVTIIPILALEYFLSQSIGSISFRSSLELSKVSVDQLEENLTNKLKVYYDMIDGLSNDLQFTKYLNTNYTSSFEALNDYNLFIRPLMSMLSYKNAESVIRVYTKNSTIGFSRITNNSMDDFVKEGWADLSNPVGGTIRWAGAGNSIKMSDKEYLGSYRFLFNDTTNEYKPESVLAVFFRKDELFSLISKEFEGGKKIFISDAKGDIVLSTENDKNYRSLKDVAMEDEYRKGSDEYSFARYEESDYIVLRKQLDHPSINVNNWSIVYMIPAGAVHSSIQHIRMTSLVLCLLCIVFSLILTVLLSRNITGRISRLLRKISNVKRGNFTISDGAEGTDEISILDNSFNEMTGRIHTLIHEVYEAEIQVTKEKLKNSIIETRAREAEIHTLQSQINPHYLFNTLESIRMKLLIKGDRESSDIIGMFGETFRLALSNHNETYKLSDELRFVESFFLIQKYRYGDRINYEKDVPAELLNVYIPKLILQPLVENAIYHGIERKAAGGTVVVLARIADGKLVLTITDNGAGMDEDELIQVRDAIDKSNQADNPMGDTRIALRNIHTRLRLLYGDPYGLVIHSSKGIGTEVTVSLPMDAS